MLRYTLKRLLQSCVTIFLIVSVVFLLLRLMPTDYYFTEDELIKLTTEQKHDRLEAAGLLDNPFVQLTRFYKALFTQGDLGESRRIQSGQPVLTVIGSKFGVSMKLGLIALGISLVLGVCLGVLQARYKDGVFDHVGTAYTVFVNAVPQLVSYSLILVFGARVLGLPSMYSTRKVLISSILPVVCLSIGSTAGYMLWIRRYMVDELNKDYIRLARLKGLSTRQVMFRHVLKNAFVPMVQQLPVSVLLTVGGSLLVERFFSVPGMGPLLTDAISRYDTNVVQALVMLYAVLGILGLFLGDVLMTVLDPRIRLTGKGGAR
ncbi:MAG: ABC transporter permease [Clostridia bacterium]|nr:ABC transporter permease [Clostridia bacterium]